VRFGYPDIDSYSRALFGQATWHVTDKLRLTGGLRYTADQKKQNGTTEVRNPAGILLSRITNFANSEWEATNWKLSAEYQLAERSLIYATAATGYKAGGNYDGLPPNSYDPEKVLSFEAGSKNRLFDNALQLNVTAFHYVQRLPGQPAGLPEPAGQPAAVHRLGPHHLQRRQGHGVRPGAGVGVGDHLGRPPGRGRRPDPLGVRRLRAAGDAVFVGRRLLGQSAAQVAEVDPDGRLLAPLRPGQRRDDHGRGPGSLRRQAVPAVRHPQPDHPQDAYTTGDVNLTYESPGGMWTVTAYANNVSNELVKSYAFATSTPGTFYGTYLPPRMYGVRVGAKF
jgi:iron complex outermembrane receptor protein